MSLAVLIFAVLLCVYLAWQAERDKKELKRQLADTQSENRALVLALTKRPIMTSPPESEFEFTEAGTPAMIPQRRRPGRFVSFGADKRRLESQEPTPSQRSVTV